MGGIYISLGDSCCDRLSRVSMLAIIRKGLYDVYFPEEWLRQRLQEMGRALISPERSKNDLRASGCKLHLSKS